MTSKRDKVVTYYKIQPIKSQSSFEHEALRSRDKLNTFHLHYTILIATSPGKVVAYSKELLPIKSCPFHHMVWLVILIFLIRSPGLKRKHFNCHRRLMPVFFLSFFCQPLPEFGGIWGKSTFYRPSIANKIRLYKKGIFRVYSFSKQAEAKGNSPEAT